MPHAADGDAETKETVGHDRGTVHRNQSDYSGKLRPAGPPADGIADQSQQGPLFPIGPHLAAFRSPPEQHANPERPQVYLLSFVSHEAQGPTKKLYELADRRRQAYAQCHSYGMIRENLDTISAFFFKFLLHEQETCRINLGPYFKNGKSFIRLKVFALWKHITSQKIPEGSWLWFLDGDAVITNFTSGVLEHVRPAPSFQAQFEEFKGAFAKDPSIFMAAHSVKPWKIDLKEKMTKTEFERAVWNCAWILGHTKEAPDKFYLPNSGSVLIRKDDAGRRVLREWICFQHPNASPVHNNNPERTAYFNDQFAAYNAMARHCNAIRVVPQRVLNSHFTTGTADNFANPTTSQWRPGDFVAHAYGLATSAMDVNRQQVVDDILQTMSHYAPVCPAVA